MSAGPSSESKVLDRFEGMEGLRQRLEVLRGAKPPVVSDPPPSAAAPLDAEQRERVTRAGGLVSAAIDVLGNSATAIGR